MKRIRINNDFTFAWAIERNGLPEDLSTAINMVLQARNSAGALQTITDYDVAGNVVSVEVTPEIANVLGRYVFILTYELPDAGLSDLERLCEIDTDAFILVPRTAEADDAEDFLVTSDMAIGFKGDSAYQVWLEAGNTGTVEDYLADIKGDSFLYSDFTPEQLEALKVKGDPFLYEDFTPAQIAELQRPATDAAVSIALLEGEIEGEEALRIAAETTRAENEQGRVTAEGTRQNNEIARENSEDDRDEAEALRLSAEITRGQNEQARINAEELRVTAEGTRQTNTAIAITNANNAATNANTKAGLADTAANNANEKAGLAATATTQANTARDEANSAAQSATNLVNSYATELQGKLAKTDIASQAEAEGNTENTKFMTALRVFQNFVKNATTYVFSVLNTTQKTITGAINEIITFIPSMMSLQTVANKNQYYPIVMNNTKTVVGKHQTAYWNGTAWVADNSLGFGAYSLSSNTGTYSSGFGQSSVESNTGVYSSGFGAYSLQNNTGGSSNGFGYLTLQGNTGGYSNGFGVYSLKYNTGWNSNGFGAYSLKYNQAANNTAIGNNSYAAFLDNTAENKTADSTAVDITLERITLAAHGFGTTNSIVNIKYASTTGTAIGGISVGNVYQVKIIDANTVEFVSGSGKINLTSQGAGNHTFTPQLAYTNTTCLGANTVPNRSNQVVLGSTAVDTVKMGGTARTIASATETGEKGEMCWDANYIYVCVATNTWKRIALTTW